MEGGKCRAWGMAGHQGLAVVVVAVSSLLQWDLGQQHRVQPMWDWLDTMGCTRGTRAGVQAGFQPLILEQQREPGLGRGFL